MRENKVERHLKQKVESKGGLCEKYTSPGKRGVPDRDITWDMVKNPPLHGIGCEKVETKAPGKKPRKKQEEDHRERRKRGALVSVLDTIEKIDAWMEERFGKLGAPTRTKPATRAQKERDRKKINAEMKEEDKQLREVHQGKPALVGENPTAVIVDDFADLI